MTENTNQSRQTRRRMPRLLAACALACVLAGAVTALMVCRRRPEPDRPDTDVPLGVEEAVIVRYRGPRLVARPYRRGASVNVRIAGVARRGDTRVYDVRYVVNLPGEFDLTDYLMSSDGSPIDDLPRFKVRGLTSLTKDIETRIQEIEDAGVHIWHWYYESLVALGLGWIGWLLALIFVGRPKRTPPPPPAPAPPSVAERIARYLQVAAERELSVDEKAQLEALLLADWRQRLDLRHERMAAVCRRIEQSGAFGHLYGKLADWLHNPNAAGGSAEFLQVYSSVGQKFVGQASRLPENAVS